MMAAVSVAEMSARTVAATRRPNIVFFLVDDYDKPETSVYGGNVLTPNLDRMAREGITFHNMYMTATVCTPSRYTCLTGRYAGSSYSDKYLAECPIGSEGLPEFNVTLEDDNMNVAAVLAKNGYATGLVGKYHVGPDMDETECTKYGLHYIPKNCEYSDEINRYMSENEMRYRQLVMDRGFTWAKHIYWQNLKDPFHFHNPEWTAAAALEFIEKHKDGPFYLYYATTLLHGPNMGWYRSLDKPLITGEGMLDKPLHVMPDRKTVMERLKKAGLSENEAGYLWMDDSLGVILDKLDELGIADNTLVVFLADHGSDLKGSMYKNRGTEVPCIMKWPAGMKRGVACHELVQSTDFVPTWFDIAGVTPPAGYKIDGVSIASLFTDPQQPVRDHVYGEIGPVRSVTTKDWSYIALRYTKEQIDGVRSGDNRAIKKLLGLSGGVARGAKKPSAFSYDQLYDLKADPAESTNLADKPRYRDKLEQMKKLLLKELKRFPNRPYGEFIPGGNAVPAGTYDDVLQTVAKAAQQNSKKPRAQKSKKPGESEPRRNRANRKRKS
ncbi:MAG: sulfatase-like hydrolase/transferase [Candidatus Hydrogenedentes bacterium]|nr:sulfatase-like hydrolase/transferase [Candidatus Hydrogenedentota bacterium]